MAKIKRIGVLTGGGDCPGLNAAIRAVAKTAITEFGLEVVGIKDGYEGAVEHRYRELGFNDVSGILSRGGTILGCNNRVNPFAYGEKKRDYSGQVLENFRQMKIDGLIVVGGDGTLAISNKFSEKGFPIVAVPKTIDNDVRYTERTIGFNSASTVAAQAIDALHSTAESHHRVMVVEVMGRYAGWIALYSGLASGADVILIPEIPYDINKVCEVIKKRGDIGKSFSIVVVAEGIKSPDGEIIVQKSVSDSFEQKRLGGVGTVLAGKIEQMLEKETRVVMLGHLLRSGMPTEFDRVLATLFGRKAVHLLMEKQFGKMVGLKCGDMDAVDIAHVIKGPKTVPPNFIMVETARSIGMSFGD